MRTAKFKSLKNTEWLILLWCMLTAFSTLLICSRSSFLYPCNDWNDANSYFTMGKAMMNGQIIYRDLYDQKGPYLYLLYGISYLFSHDSFAGVFLMEILAGGLFLYACCRILRLYCCSLTSCLLLPFLAAVVYSTESFYWGGAAEEFCLPLLAFSLYFILRYFKEQYPASLSADAGTAVGTPAGASVGTAVGMPVGTLLLNAVFCGIIMQVKYTMLGFYFAWAGLLALSCLLRRNVKQFLKTCLIFLSGMFLTLIPWLIYFGIHDALDDWYQCYIYNNVFLYSTLGEAKLSLFERLYELIKLFYFLILDNPFCFALLIGGVIFLLLFLHNHWYEKLLLPLLLGFLFLGIYVGGSNLPYYAIPLSIFAAPGMAFVGVLIERLWKLFQKGPTRKAFPLPAAGLLFLLSLAIGMGFSYRTSMNTYFMQQDQDSYFLYQFAEIVNQEESPTLLNISCLDAGLYTVADVMPSCRFFQTNGIAFDEMFTAQEQYVAEGRTQFILARDYYPDCIRDHYTLVAQAPYEWAGTAFTYYLFKRT